MMKHARPLASLLILVLIAPIFSGCTDLFDDNSPPTVNMSIDPSGTLKADQSATFSAVGTSDADGDSLTFNWEFGDGNTGQGLTTSHTYKTQGEYLVKLRVSDGTHETTVTKTVNVVNSDAREPKAEIYQEKQEDCEGEEPSNSVRGILYWVCEDDKDIDDRDIEVSITVTLDGSPSWAGCDPDNSDCYAEEYLVSYKWDLDLHSDSDGDGDLENDVDATGEIYEWKDVPSGAYEIRLTVEDNNGFVSSDESMVYVNYRGVWNDFVLGRVANNPQSENAACVDEDYPCELTWSFPLNYEDPKDKIRYYRAKLTYPQKDDDQPIGSIGDDDNKLDMYLKNETDEPVTNTTSLGNDNRDAGDCSSDDYCVWLQIGGSTVRSFEPGTWTIDVKNEKTHNTDVKHMVIELQYR